jgi:hypothetical protein
MSDPRDGFRRQSTEQLLSVFWANALASFSEALLATNAEEQENPNTEGAAADGCSNLLRRRRPQ